MYRALRVYSLPDPSSSLAACTRPEVRKGRNSTHAAGTTTAFVGGLHYLCRRRAVNFFGFSLPGVPSPPALGLLLIKDFSRHRSFPAESIRILCWECRSTIHLPVVLYSLLVLPFCKLKCLPVNWYVSSNLRQRTKLPKRDTHWVNNHWRQPLTSRVLDTL